MAIASHEAGMLMLADGYGQAGSNPLCMDIKLETVAKAHLVIRRASLQHVQMTLIHL